MASVKTALDPLGADGIHRASPQSRYERVAAALLGRRLSRRSALQLGLGAGASLPFIGAIARSAASFHFEHDSRSVRVSADGEPLWIIDCSRFSGDPQLRVKRNEERILIRLAGAKYPGTVMSPDFVCVVRRKPGGWTFRMVIPQIGFDARADFGLWLIGKDRLAAQCNRAFEVLAHHDLSLAIDRQCEVEFTPDWTTRISGTSGANLKSLISRAELHEVEVSLPGLQEPSLLDPAVQRKTRFWLSAAGGHEVAASVGDALFRVTDASPELMIDAGQTAAGKLTFAHLARAEREDTSAGYVSQVFGEQQSALRICIVQNTCDQSRLTAFASVFAKSEWLQFGDWSAEYSAADRICRVMADSHDPKMQSRDGYLTRLVVPMRNVDEAIFLRVGAFAPDDGFDCAPLASIVRSGFDDRSWFQWTLRKSLSLDDFVLRINRGYTGLHTRIRFRNIDLVDNFGTSMLEGRAGVEALVEIDVGSQHLEEEALYISDLSDGRTPPKVTALSDELVADYYFSRAVAAKDGKPPYCEHGYVWPGEQADWDLLKSLNKSACDWARALDEKKRWGEVSGKALARYQDCTASSSPVTGIRTRAAEPTYVVFSLQGERGSPGRIRLSLDDLFQWNKAKGSGWLELKRATRALPETKSVDEQKKIKDLPIEAPARLGAKLSGTQEYGSLIVAPYRLGISPITEVNWKGPQAGDRKSGQPVELWHRKAYEVRMRAIWSPDFAQDRKDFWTGPAHWPSGSGMFRTSVSAHDRHELVALTSVYGRDDALLGSQQVVGLPNESPNCTDWGGTFVPRPFSARFLALSSHGATMRIHGDWDPPASKCAEGALTVKLWDHGMQVGRDTKVVVEYKGFLFPLGHPCTLVKETERLFVKDIDAKSGAPKGYKAYLVQRFFIRVPEFTRTFKAMQQPLEGRGWPFATNSTDKWKTPDLADPTTDQIAGLGEEAFWPILASDKDKKALVDFPFKDDTQRLAMQAPLAFVNNDVAHSAIKLQKVIAAYRKIVVDSMGLSATATTTALDRDSVVPQKGTVRVLSGRLRFAPSLKVGDTDFVVPRFALDVDIPDPRSATIQPIPSGHCRANLPGIDFSEFEERASVPTSDQIYYALVTTPQMEASLQPPFYPHLRQARVRSDVSSRMSGRETNDAIVEFDASYLQNGFDPKLNAGELFLRSLWKRVRLDFAGNTTASGGIACPTQYQAAVSRKRGPVGGDGLQPVLVGYRYQPISTSPAIASTASTAGGEMSWANMDGFDPQRAFGGVLGDAKLLGIVRLADILEVVALAAGSKAPSLIQKFEHDLGRPAVQALLPQLKSAVQSARVASTQLADLSPVLKKRLDDRLQALDDALAVLTDAVSGGSDDQVVARFTDLVMAANAFADVVREAASDPRSFLPPQFADLLQAGKDLLSYLETLRSNAGTIEKQVADALGTLAAGEADALIKEIKERPEYVELAGQLNAMRTEGARLVSETRAVSTELLITLSQHLLPLLKAEEEVLNWCQWLDQQVNQMCQSLLGFALALEASATRGSRDITNAAAVVIDAADKIRKAVSNTQPLPAALVTANERLAQFEAAIGTFSRAIADRTTADTAAIERIRQDIASACATSVSARVRADMDVVRGAIDHVVGGGVSALFQRLDDLSSGLKAFETALAAQQKQGALAQTPAASTPSVADLKKAIAQFLLEVLQPDALTKGLKDLAGQIPDVPQKGWLLEIVTSLQGWVQGVEDPLKRGDFDAAVKELPAAWGKLRTLVLAVGPLDQNVRLLAQALRARLDGQLVSLEKTTCRAVASFFAGSSKQVNTYLANLSTKDAQRLLSATLIGKINELGKAFQDLSVYDETKETPVGYATTLSEFPAHLKQALADLQRTLSSGNPSDLVNVQGAVDSLLAFIGVPTRATISYDWSTPVKDYPEGAGAVFIPADSKTLTISSKGTVDLRQPTAPTFSIVATLDRFAISLLGDAPFLRIRFRPVTFTAGTGQSPHMQVDVEGVDLGGSLGFVQKLKDWLLGDSGFFVRAADDRPGVVVGYEYNRDSVQLTAFTLQNVDFSITCTLPFDNSPAFFDFKLSDQTNPFLVSAGIYGGGGYVGIRSRADTLEYIEAAFEYGLVTSFDFGPAHGSGRVTAGIYIRYAGGSVTVGGYFLATGSASIAGLITIAACFRVIITYESATGAVQGAATFEISFKISVVEFKYSVGVSYSRAGDGPASNAGALEQSSPRTVLAASGDFATDAVEPCHAKPATPSNTDHDLSQCLLEEKAWRSYWQTFAEERYELRL